MPNITTNHAITYTNSTITNSPHLGRPLMTMPDSGNSKPDKCLTNVRGGIVILGIDCLNEIIIVTKACFLQSLLWKMTTIQEQTLLTTSSFFQKRPLVVTVKRRLMLHREIKLKYPQTKAPSHRIAVSVKCQNLPVIKVCNN